MLTSQKIVSDAATGIKIIGDIASVEKRVMPYAMMIGGLFPGVATVLAAVSIAQPYIDKVAEYAPQVATLVQDRGVPVIDAIKSVAPSALGHLKSAYAALAKADPTLSHVTLADITDAMAAEMFKTLMAGSFFTPQDPRFNRIDAASIGG